MVAFRPCFSPEFAADHFVPFSVSILFGFYYLVFLCPLHHFPFFFIKIAMSSAFSGRDFREDEGVELVNILSRRGRPSLNVVYKIVYPFKRQFLCGLWNLSPHVFCFCAVFPCCGCSVLFLSLRSGDCDFTCDEYDGVKEKQSVLQLFSLSSFKVHFFSSTILDDSRTIPQEGISFFWFKMIDGPLK